ncbi:serine/threonine-protein kinase SBK2 isoform X2 [Canis lupus baileyi]|uniref:serine/threonine-protein kinase SBK2 isoform X2 n=1 Tax=Canis lupus baileyi TaxID=143281 RepID=UPI003B97B3E4
MKRDSEQTHREKWRRQGNRATAETQSNTNPRTQSKTEASRAVASETEWEAQGQSGQWGLCQLRKQLQQGPGAPGGSHRRWWAGSLTQSPLTLPGHKNRWPEAGGHSYGPPTACGADSHQGDPSEESACPVPPHPRARLWLLWPRTPCPASPRRFCCGSEAPASGLGPEKYLPERVLCGPLCLITPRFTPDPGRTLADPPTLCLRPGVRTIWGPQQDAARTVLLAHDKCPVPASNQPGPPRCVIFPALWASEPAFHAGTDELILTCSSWEPSHRPTQPHTATSSSEQDILHLRSRGGRHLTPWPHPQHRVMAPSPAQGRGQGTAPSRGVCPMYFLDLKMWVH